MSDDQSATIELRVPDIGDIDVVDVIEILVSPGDLVEVDSKGFKFADRWVIFENAHFIHIILDVVVIHCDFLKF